MNQEQNGALAVLNNCTVGTTGAVVSTTPSPVDTNPSPQYLTSPAPQDPDDTVNNANALHYYNDVIHAPTDFNSFKSKFQFGTGGDEVSAVYFNNGDRHPRRRGEHPAWDLEVKAVGITHGRAAIEPTRDGQDREFPPRQWMERIADPKRPVFAAAMSWLPEPLNGS